MILYVWPLYIALNPGLWRCKKKAKPPAMATLVRMLCSSNRNLISH